VPDVEASRMSAPATTKPARVATIGRWPCRSIRDLIHTHVQGENLQPWSRRSPRRATNRPCGTPRRPRRRSARGARRAPRRGWTRRGGRPAVASGHREPGGQGLPRASIGDQATAHSRARSTRLCGGLRPLLRTWCGSLRGRPDRSAREYPGST
jgi:hypothetical protein